MQGQCSYVRAVGDAGPYGDIRKLRAHSSYVRTEVGIGPYGDVWKFSVHAPCVLARFWLLFPRGKSSPPEARTSRFHHHSPPEQKPAGDSPRLSPAQSSKSLTEFAALGPRIKSNPFFAAACTSQKTLCAESECRRLAKASQGTERSVNFFSKRARLF